MRKNYYTILFVALTQVVHAQFQFVSPSDGSKNLPISHNVIIRPGSEIDSTSLHSSLFRIQGSKSGIHEFKIELCSDRKTIILNLKLPFEFNETVTVSVSRGLVTTKKKVIDAYSFSFSTHRKWNADEQAKINSTPRLLREEETEPMAVNSDSSTALKVAGMFTITTNTNPAPGNIFFECRSALTPPSIYNSIDIINNDGDSIFQRTFSVFPYDFKLLKNGYLETYQGNINKFLVMDSNFAVIDTYAAANGYDGDQHELDILTNGYAFLIANEFQFMAIGDTADSAEVIGTVIQEFDPNHNVVFEWRSLDHVAVEEAEHVDLSTDMIDYIHTNSIEVDTDGNIIVSHRHLDQITKIDVNTGEFIWRLGGVYNEFNFANDSDRFSYQHDCRRLPNGNITLYDDGNYHSPPKSYAKEYRLDLTNMTATLVWSYSHPDVNGIVAFYSAMGSVQRLSNGNTLIGWGYRTNTTLPSITEVDSLGNILWELKLLADHNLINYRVHKYDWNPCARPTFELLNTTDIDIHSATSTWHTIANPLQQYEFQYKKHDDSIWIDKNIAPSQQEVNLTNLDANTEYDWRIQSWCDTLSGDSSRYTDVVNFTTLLATFEFELNSDSAAIYPNPASNVIDVSCNCKVSKIRILNLLGQEVKSISRDDENTDQPFEVGLENLPPGNYFVEIIHGTHREMKKLVIQQN